MNPIFWLLYKALGILSFLLLVWIILSWLINFQILNTSNRFVFAVNDTLNRLFEPMLRRIRKVMPDLGSIDLSPILLFLIIEFLQYCILYISVRV